MSGWICNFTPRGGKRASPEYPAPPSDTSPRRKKKTTDVRLPTAVTPPKMLSQL
jgi:hypothetical protein